MSAARPQQLQIAWSPHGVLVAHAEPALDATVTLRLETATGALSAVLANGRVVACGHVSDRCAGHLAAADVVVWSRLDETDGTRVAVSEVALKRI